MKASASTTEIHQTLTWYAQTLTKRTYTWWCNQSDSSLKVKKTSRHTHSGPRVAACGLEDGEDNHFQQVLCFFFFYFDFWEVLSILVAFLGLSDRSSSHLTDIRTHNLCLSLCIQLSGGSVCGTKLCQDLIFVLPSFVLSTLPQTFIFPAHSSALWRSVSKQTNINTHNGRGRLPAQIWNQ